jgi:putative SOS response-associated peptidase YedK
MCGELRLESRGLYNPIGVFHPNFFSGGVFTDTSLKNTAQTGSVDPGTKVPIGVAHPDIEDACLVKGMIWGMRPTHTGGLLYNARSETILNKATFVTPFMNGQQGIVVARMFNEGPKWFSIKDGSPFGMAAVYNDTGFAIITCEANSLVKPWKHRMPCILPANKWSAWLSKDGHTPKTLLLKPLNPEHMRVL